MRATPRSRRHRPAPRAGTRESDGSEARRRTETAAVPAAAGARSPPPPGTPTACDRAIAAFDRLAQGRQSARAHRHRRFCSSARRSSRSMLRTTACSRSSCASSGSRSARSHCSSSAGVCARDAPSMRSCCRAAASPACISPSSQRRGCTTCCRSRSAFVLLVVIALAAAVLAVAQNALSLAVIGTAGGFLAPILVSTGSGNHVALFTYYAILNLGVFAVAWFRTWRVLNVLGFVFTFTITGLWRATSYQDSRSVQRRCVPDPVLPDVRRGLDAELRAPAAEPEGLCLRLAGVRLAGRRVHAARDDGVAHRVRDSRGARSRSARSICCSAGACSHAPRDFPAAGRSLRRARRDLREPRDSARLRHAHDCRDVGGRGRGTAVARRASGAEACRGCSACCCRSAPASAI